MPLSNDGIAPDRFELWVRFICGALFGGLVGLSAVRTSSPKELAIVAILGALACGLLARHSGDRFWMWLRSLVWWGRR
jgi:hypothetical protein